MVNRLQLVLSGGGEANTTGGQANTATSTTGGEANTPTSTTGGEANTATSTNSPIPTAAVLSGGGEGSPRYLNDTEMAAALGKIKVTPRDPSMCNNLLACTLLFVERLLKVHAEIDGTLVVALGDGRAFHITYPIRYPPPITSIMDAVIKGARNITRPTVFQVGCVDGDLFGYVVPECPSKPINPEHNPHVLSQDFPFVFFLAPSVTYSGGGRIVPNSIPIPDSHTIDGGPSVAECENRPITTDGEIASRPSTSIFFGATTGGSRDVGRGPSYSFANRFQLVDQLLGTNISNVHFTNVVQDVSLPKEYMGSSVSWSLWKTKARFVIDVDGNTNAWSAFNWKLCTGGPVIKVNSSNKYIQWYYHLLEHGVNVHVVDVLRQDVEEEVRRVLDDIPYATKLANGAAAFCCKYLRGDVQKLQLQTTVANIWESLPELKARDWRIKSPPSDHLRPLISPYVRYGPMKRIKQALMADVGDHTNTSSAPSSTTLTDKNAVPTSLLNLAKLVDIREVCVFGTIYPAPLNKLFWSGHFEKSLQFKPTVADSTGGRPCDLVVLLEDTLSGVTGGALHDIVNKEYHVIVSLGVSARNATALRTSEVVVAEWPSVSGVVTQIQSLLKYPDNYNVEKMYSCP